MESKDRTRTLEEVLKSCSDTMYPKDIGEAEVQLDSKDIEGDTPLHVMGWRNDTEGAAILIDAGADINAIGDMNETPLHVALTQENEALVELLLQKGAKTNLRSEFNQTAIQKAKMLGGKFYQIFKKYNRV